MNTLLLKLFIRPLNNYSK